MKNFFVAFLVFLVWSFFGLWIYSWLQDTRPATLKNKTEDISDANEKSQDSLQLTTSEVALVNTDDTLLKTKETHGIPRGLKAINPTGDIVFLYDEGISIVKNNSEITIPESCKDYKYKVNTYMLENPDKELHITGLYSPDEEVQFPNLGVLRAKKIKQELLQLGVPDNKMVTKSMIKPLFDNDSIFTNAIRFSFKPINLDRIEALKNKIPENKVVYPKFSNSGIMVNDELENVLQEILTFTAVNPNLKIKVIGHTDNIGNAEDNYLLGLKFARQVRWYFIAKGGINKSNITASSKGETEPIADNKTQHGRKANNRIEIVFY